MDQHPRRRFVTAEVFEAEADGILPLGAAQHDVEDLVGFNAFNEVDHGVHGLFGDHDHNVVHRGGGDHRVERPQQHRAPLQPGQNLGCIGAEAGPASGSQ